MTGYVYKDGVRGERVRATVQSNDDDDDNDDGGRFMAD